MKSKTAERYVTMNYLSDHFRIAYSTLQAMQFNNLLPRTIPHPVSGCRAWNIESIFEFMDEDEGRYNAFFDRAHAFKRSKVPYLPRNLSDFKNALKEKSSPVHCKTTISKNSGSDQNGKLATTQEGSPIITLPNDPEKVIMTAVDNQFIITIPKDLLVLRESH